MKHHVIIVLRRRLADDLGVPAWLDFIRDKSVVRETLEPAVDRLMSGLGVKFWITREYDPAGAVWSTDEVLHGLDRTYRMIFQQDFALPKDLVVQIKRVATVEDAHELNIGEAELPAPRLSEAASVGMPRLSESINLAYAHAVTKGHPDVRIAVLDTGVHLLHRELEGRIVARADFVDLEGLPTSGFIGDFKGYDDVPDDEVGHGTHVSGIVAAKGLQMDEGVCPGCSLMAVRVLATMKANGRLVGAGIVDNINAGIKWAVDHGADVINMSLGVKHVGGGLPHENVIRYALSKGVTVVAASGNDGTAERYYPGALRGVIAVGAIDSGGTVTGFTSYGANITVVAPGVQVYSAYTNNTYAFASGTSQAAPFVSGAVGLMKSYAVEQGRRLTNAEIIHILKHTSDKVDRRLRNEHAGYGLINLADAFKLLAHMSN